MDVSISLGNLLEIVTIVLGFAWQHFSMVERIVKLEVKHDNMKEDTDRMFEQIRVCIGKHEIGKINDK